MIRIVLDTNVIISAFVFKGLPDKVYRLAINDEIELVISPFIIEEVDRVLRDKIGWNDREIKDALRQLKRVADIVDPKEKINVISGDETDNRILECAIECQAHYLVSGDKHLLDLKKHKGIRILKPSDFINLILSQ